MHYHAELMAAREKARLILENAPPKNAYIPGKAEEIRKHLDLALQQIGQRVTGLINANSDLVNEMREERRKRERAEALYAAAMDALVASAERSGMTREDVEESMRITLRALGFKPESS